ncbi:MAG: hypothetical protein U0X20_13575 [Caldilineaceae bacterium]
MQPFSKHLSFEYLVDLAEGRLASADSGDARSHLEGCAECRTALSKLENIIVAMQSNDLLTPPQYVTQRALQIFRPTEKPVSTLQAGLQSLVALLRFDSGLTPAFGMRSGAGEARQLFYTVNEFDIDLRLAPRAEEWRIEGQLLGGDTGGVAELVSTGRRYTGELNDLGEFAFANVHADSYRLSITLPGLEITVPELVLSK